ncbi:hypothetical protein RESH_02949 [Rhodopirellula europaea SH398]|uniref:Uncharacterized protein n=1 Tax=Rhodopirellula europaea SH398 TaxID=1263868 RepID=M5SJQ8_9BACT|nr:hypothetical protein RESH_02949 [Rhodopirellula europaea SH398]
MDACRWSCVGTPSARLALFQSIGLAAMWNMAYERGANRFLTDEN